MTKQNPQHKGAIAAILFSLLVVMMGYGALLPVLPFYVERLALSAGVDQQTINFHIGGLTAIYSFFQLVFALIWGYLSDRLGRRVFIVMGLLGFMLMQVLIGLSTSLTMLYTARISGGIITAAMVPVSHAYLSDITSHENRRRVMAWSGTAISTGLITGPVAGGLLSKTDFHLSWKSGIFHLDKFSIPFLTLLLPGIIALFLVLKRLKDQPAVPVQVVTKGAPTTARSAGFSLLILLCLSFLYQFSVTSFETVFSIYAKNELSFSAYQIGVAFMLCGFFMALLQPVFVSPKTKMITAEGMLLIGFLTAALSLFAFPFIKSPIVVYLLISLLAVGGAMIAPLLTALVSLLDDRHTAKTLSFQTSVNSAAQVFGPLTGTWLTAKQELIPFLLNGSLLLIPVLFLSRLRKGQTSNPPG